MSDFLESIYKERDKQVRELNIQGDQWVNLDDEFGDVWHQIESVYTPSDWYGSVYYYQQVDSKGKDVKRVSTYFHNIRKVAPVLPKDARCVYCKEGAFSERRNNLKDVPSHYYENK